MQMKKQWHMNFVISVSDHIIWQNEGKKYAFWKKHFGQKIFFDEKLLFGEFL